MNEDLPEDWRDDPLENTPPVRVPEGYFASGKKKSRLPAVPGAAQGEGDPPATDSHASGRHPELTAPENQRVIIFGTMPTGLPEMGMGWKDRLDKLWYFAPQGGIVPFKVREWCPVPGET